MTYKGKLGEYSGLLIGKKGTIVSGKRKYAQVKAKNWRDAGKKLRKKGGKNYKLVDMQAD